MNRLELQFTEAQFRDDAELRSELDGLISKRAFVLALQVLKNSALSPKLPPHATTEVRCNLHLLMQGVSTVIADLDRLCLPLDKPETPNPSTHFRDPVLGEWFAFEELPLELRQAPPEPKEHLPQPRKPKAKK